MLKHVHRWHILLLGVVVLGTFCVLAAAKLRATPKYDRIQVGEPAQPSGVPVSGGGSAWTTTRNGTSNVEVVTRLRFSFETDEGRIDLDYTLIADGAFVTTEKHIVRRGPLERLAWLAGWRPAPALPAPPPLPAVLPPPHAPAAE